MALWWGPEHAVIYNDGYIPIAGNKHPDCLGKSAAEYWGDKWQRLQPIFESVMKGESVATEDSCVFINRNGYTEVIPFCRG